MAAPSKQMIHPARTLLTNLRHLLKRSDSQVRVQFVVPDTEISDIPRVSRPAR